MSTYNRFISIHQKLKSMKRIFCLFTMFALFTLVLPAQVQPDKVTISKTELTADQLTKLEAQQKLDLANQQISELQGKIETYGKWVGVGGEVGTAVKEGLTAVVDVADKFGKTDVGKFTLIMVAWKVMGQDVVRILLGLLFFTVLTIIILKVYRRVVIARKVLIENPGFLRYPKKYEVVKTELDSDGVTIVTLILVAAYLIGIWITYGIMF